MSEETEKAWEDKCRIIAATLPCLHPNCDLQTRDSSRLIYQLLSDYKASLREEIEKLPNDGVINGRKKGRQALLDLIDSVVPLK